MSHEIMNNDKFYGHREAAWHQLGTVSQEPHTAVEAGEIVGLPKIYQMPLYIQGQAHQIVAEGYNAIVGCLPGEQPHGQYLPPDGNGLGDYTICTYGVVSSDYATITHSRFCELWDEATGGAPVETLGVLGKGDRLFVTVELPTFDVKGDEMRSFLFGYNPVNGRQAVTARQTHVRVVCANTVAMALSGQTAFEYRGVHYQGVEDRLLEWLRGVWARQVDGQALVKEAYELLADKRIEIPALSNHVINVVYPFTPEPNKDELTGEALEIAMNEYLDKCAAMQKHRDGVIELFEGSPNHTEATRGTLWGAVQAVAEYEDHGRLRGTAMSAVFGEGAARKDKALNVCLALARA
jgi:phage/plasmid-like protein (TIGR03299 family)